MAALRFFFVRTLHRHEFREYLPYPKTRKKLPNILSREEVARLINASSSLFQRTLLMCMAISNHRITAFETLQKGQLITLEGTLRYREVEDEVCTRFKHRITEVHATSMKRLSKIESADDPSDGAVDE